MTEFLRCIAELAKSPLSWTLAMIAVFTTVGYLLAGYRLYRKIGVTRWEAFKLAVSDLPWSNND